MYQRSFLLAALILATGSSVVSAQSTVVRCGGGTTVTAGVTINSAGELVFPENSIVCGTTASPLPQPLQMVITSPTSGQEVSIANGPQPVAFSASLTNFTSPYDQCPNVALTAPGGSTTNVALGVVSNGQATHTASATLNIAADALTGSYSARLNCTRVVDNQQIVLNPPTVQFSVVGGGIVPEECDLPPSNMQINTKNYSDSHPQGFGKAFGTLSGTTSFDAGNQVNPPAATIFKVRAWRFTAPLEPKTGIITLPPGHSGITSFSTCPGIFDVPATCRKSSSNTSIKWTTKASEPGACLLEPGQVYYFNGAHFNLADHLSNGAYNSTCGCTNPPCSGCKLAYVPGQAQ